MEEQYDQMVIMICSTAGYLLQAKKNRELALLRDECEILYVVYHDFYKAVDSREETCWNSASYHICIIIPYSCLLYI